MGRRLAAEMVADGMRCAPPPAPRPTARRSRPPERSAGSVRPIAWPRCAGRSRTSRSPAGCSARPPVRTRRCAPCTAPASSFFLGGAIDTTVRGVLYEASGTTVPPQVSPRASASHGRWASGTRCRWPFSGPAPGIPRPGSPRLARRSRQLLGGSGAVQDPSGEVPSERGRRRVSRSSRCSRIRAVAPR